MPLVAATGAIVTSAFVPPDAAWAGYFDKKTLACLFSTLAVICALRNVRFFAFLSQRIVRGVGNLRAAVLALIWITFLGSMLIANDMALLTFLPLGHGVLVAARQEKYVPFTFVMQNIAANLGGMLTPFGNPQNLYLYEKFRIPAGEFVGIMLIPFLASVTLMTLCCLWVPRTPVGDASPDAPAPPRGRTALYLALFAVAILTVFRLVPYLVCVAAVLVVLLVADRKALLRVDYRLLLTFVCFFIFAGNLSRIPAARRVLSALMEKNTLLFSVLSCQVISNVPSAILLSQFTDDYRHLLMGVNIGGAGTLIASLASLITFRAYTARYRGRTAAYLGLFSALNFGFLAVLTVLCLFL
ncbi:MAG: citrate transporter [Clostridia bacterium]|nr:citrate transporter [Clostridia bacterium]